MADFVYVLRLLELGSWESVAVARRKNALAGSYTASVAGSSLGYEVSSSTDLNKIIDLKMVLEEFSKKI